MILVPPGWQTATVTKFAKALSFELCQKVSVSWFWTHFKPFQDWESFIESKFTLNTYPKDVTIGALFAQSKPNTIYKRIFENNMDEQSFNYPQDSIKRTVLNVNHAYLGDLSTLLEYKDLSCKVI